MRYIPFYTTRPDADGDIGSYELVWWLPLVAIIIFLLNVIVWGLTAFIFWVEIVLS